MDFFLLYQKMPIVKTNDIETYYEVQGEGHPLLLISGINCDHAILWQTVKDALAQDYQVITYAPRGVAPSSAPDSPYSVELMADDAAALLTKLKIPSAHILGYSMGGMIAQSLAISHPDKVDNLILAATTAKISALNRIVCEGCKKILARGVPREEAGAVMLPWFFSNSFLSMFLEGKLNGPIPKLDPIMPQSASGLFHQFEALATFDRRESLGSINVPTLIIAGEKDLLMPIEDAQELASLIPDARLVAIPHAGHLLIHENPTAFLQMISAFMKSTI